MMLKRLLTPLASLKLTVVLLILSIVLVYAGTWAQIDQSVWTVQSTYFYSWFTWVDFQTLLPRRAPGQFAIPGGFPMPGGYLIGTLMLINLAVAHGLRFRFSWLDLLVSLPLLGWMLYVLWLWQENHRTGWMVAALVAGALLIGVLYALHPKRAGIILIHLGIIILLVGQIFTSIYAVETRMVIDEGQTVHYSEDIREVELAIIDSSPADHDQVTVVRDWRLRRPGVISEPNLPFAVQVDAWYPNSVILGPQQAGAFADPRATAGLGRGLTVRPQPPATGTEMRVDVPSAYVTLIDATGNSLGRFLVSPYLDQPQQVDVNGKSYWIELRFRRYYKPYALTLLDFRHDRHTGTNMPKNFSSLVRLVDPSRNEDRRVLIWMNHPLRYGGETFYQAGFRENDTTTELQVVRNSGWVLPYVACVIGGTGMLLHFAMHLISFLARRTSQSAGLRPVAAPASYSLAPKRNWAAGRVLAPLIVVIVALVFIGSLFVPHSAGPFDLGTFGRWPMSFEGRVQPLDSVARNSLRAISGREILRTDAGTKPAIEWLADTMARLERADQYAIFRIDHPDLISLLGLDENHTRHSFAQIEPKLPLLQQQLTQALATDERHRTLYQRKLLELGNKLQLYMTLGQTWNLYLAAPVAPGGEWTTLAASVAAAGDDPQKMHSAMAVLAAVESYRAGSADQFNEVAQAYHQAVASHLPAVATRVDFESMFNRVEPFYSAIVLYVAVFLLAIFSWIFWQRPLQRAALALLVVTLVFHTLALLGRIYISGRPPVTNLYSSAIFIAWGAGLFALIIELIYRNGIGSVTAAAVGFASLIIAHNLSTDGDTMPTLRAVLDTNFWLATHVVAITLGYSATFLAGFLAIIYVIRGVLTPSFPESDRRDLGRMIYGVICFGLLLSFVGTVLGGIWADQSWGRFWGWDPKENGALLLVLWNALILHARWDGMIRNRGLAVLAIGGNIVTAWSWFGTNMLGVGLHSYGFMSSGLMWLLLFVASQVLLIGLGTLPEQMWLSRRRVVAAASHTSGHETESASSN